MKFGRFVTVDGGGNYVTVHKLNVRRIIRHNKSLIACPTHIVLRMKQVNFKAQLHGLHNHLVNRAAWGRGAVLVFFTFRR